MIYASSTNIFGFEVTYLQLSITIGLIILLVIAAIAFRQNIRTQMRVSNYMDNECNVYNRNGLEMYLFKNRKRLSNPTLVAVELKNLALIAKNSKGNLPYNVATILINGLNKEETIGRLEYSKFVVVYNNKSKEDIKRICTEFDQTLNGPDSKFNSDVNFAVTFGVYENPSLENTKMALVLAEYTLTYSNVKEKNMYFYCDEVNMALNRKDRINEQKQAALEEKRFVSFIQPKVSLATGKVVGGEILCRWLDEYQKPVYYPNEFIPVFEENGFVKEVDKLMLENGARLAQILVRNGHPDIQISVNLSKINFETKNFASEIYNIVTNAGASPRNIEIEITETTIMNNSTFVANCIMELRQLGFKVAMDDFGKEYSSLGLLSSNPFDIIKLDSIFFKDGLSTEKTKGIVHDLLHMLAKLDYEIVCEGIETKEVVNIIGSINPNVIIQGYYFSKPIPVYQFEAFVNTTYEFDFETEVEQEPVKEVKAEAKEAVIEETNADNDERVRELEERINQMQKLFETQNAKHQEQLEQFRAQAAKQQQAPQPQPVPQPQQQNNYNQYPNQPYGGPYQGQPYPNQQYGGPYQGQPYPNQPYGAPYQGQPYPNQQYGNPYAQQGFMNGQPASQLSNEDIYEEEVRYVKKRGPRTKTVTAKPKPEPEAVEEEEVIYVDENGNRVNPEDVAEIISEEYEDDSQFDINHENMPAPKTVKKMQAAKKPVPKKAPVKIQVKK